MSLKLTSTNRSVSSSNFEPASVAWDPQRLDPLPFPADAVQQFDEDRRRGIRRHDAEYAIEHAQRCLDRVRYSFDRLRSGSDDDQPRAA